MRTIFIFLALLILQTDSYSCSWAPLTFCKSSHIMDTMHTNLVIVSGVISNSDDDGVDLEVIDILGGAETRTSLRIWDGTDFDCNGLHSMAAGDFLRLGDSLIIMLPMIEDIENSWDQLGDYRMPNPWWASPILQIEEGIVSGYILGDYNDDSRVTELPYDYFAREFLGSGICDLELPNLAVSFFHDENQNGRWDYLEDYLPLGAVSIPELGQFQNFKQTGIFLFAPEGSLTVSYDPSNTPDWTTSGESSFEIDVQSESTHRIRIGLIPTRSYSNLVHDISHDRFRCGEDIAFVLTNTNEGTTPTSGTFWLEVDPRLESYIFEEEPDYTNTADGIFGWDYEDLGAYQSKRIPFIVTAPLITDPGEVGEIYVFKVKEDINATRDISCYEVELRCAFDPNDKQVFPLREDKLALKSVPLRYTIRFQNTGNDYAKNVIITDTLDDRLDLSTFKLISTSHPRQLTISSNEGYDKEFEFVNIFLPDSISDEPNSHGQITFSISTKPEVLTDTEIENTASIYFDFNPAIITNTVRSIMVDSFPVSNTIEVEKLVIQSHPNPATELLYFNQQVDEVSLYDLSGRLAKTAKHTLQLKISDLDEGIYLMVLSEGEERVTRRVVVMKQ